MLQSDSPEKPRFEIFKGEQIFRCLRTNVTSEVTFLTAPNESIFGCVQWCSSALFTIRCQNSVRSAKRARIQMKANRISYRSLFLL